MRQPMHPVIHTISTPAEEMLRLFAEGVARRAPTRLYWPNPPEPYEITLPSRINLMEPHAGDDYTESPAHRLPNPLE